MECCRILLVLMWKHLTVRKRRYIKTPIELFAPSVFFLLIFLTRDEFKNDTPAELQAFSNIHQTEELPLNLMMQPSLLLYMPESPLANRLMAEVGRQLKLPRLDHFPYHDARGYYAIKNESSLDFTKLTKTVRDTSAIIIIEGMKGESLPTRLNYTIRMKVDFMTREYKSLDETIGPHERFGTIYEPFMRLQWAIDTSYLRLLTGEDIPQTVTMQEFAFVSNKNKDAEGLKTMCEFMNSACFISLMLPFMFLMTRLLEERTSGVQELIKMVGVSNNLLAFSHFLNMMPEGLVFAISGAVLAKASSTPMLPASSGTLIFVALILHYLTLMSIAFVCSYITKSTTYTTTLSILCYIVVGIPKSILSGHPLPKGLKLLTGLAPFYPIKWFWAECEYLEVTGEGISFSTMNDAHTPLTESVFTAYNMMVVQMCLFFLLAWYLSKVRPGTYGVALPWNFCCKITYWLNKETRVDADPAEESISEHTPDYFEDPPADAEVGIKIVNVSKVFGKYKALSNVSFDVLKGEITILLGHNGAGKTTLMSIITGMYASNGGKIYVNGMDIAEQSSRVRRQMGLCPQHNLVFPALNVLENVMLFAMLKGNSYSKAKQSSLELLEKLGIGGKAYTKPENLSGGMKRRLQLACALSGGANVLILDEPTSGLDVETRRELWDLLLSLRGERTVLLTTHFMEEADALGDRVAALHGGKVRCHATPMFLKKSIGTGYRLTLTTIGLPKEAEITALVTGVIPEATLKEKSYNSLSYNLPAQSSQNFPRLFEDLESHRSELGIDNIGVGVSTLEEVFLRLCSDVDTKFSKDTVDSNAPEPTYTRSTGCLLYLRQALVLMIRHLRYLWFKRWMFLMLQVVTPILVILLITFTSNKDFESDKKKNKNMALSLDLDMYDEMPERRVLYNVEHNASVKALEDSYQDIKFQETKDVAKAVLQAGMKGIRNYEQYLAGVEVNRTNAKVLYTTSVRHAAPVALNILSNILAAEAMPWADGKVIITNNYPLEESFVPVSKGASPPPLIKPKEIISIVIWCIFIVFVILGVLMMATTLPIVERTAGTRHIHMMSGCPPAVHWLATLLFHTLIYSVALIPATMAACSLDNEQTINEKYFAGAIGVVLLLGIMAFLSFVYLVSFNCSEQSAGLILTVVVIFFGLVPGVLKVYSDSFSMDLGKWNVLCDLTSYVIPAHTLTSAMLRASMTARYNARCALNFPLCKYDPSVRNMAFALMEMDDALIAQCCQEQLVKESPSYPVVHCYLCTEFVAPGKDLIILICQTVVYMTLVILTQYGVFNSLYDRLTNCKYKPPAPRFHDGLVRAEKLYVSKVISLPTSQISEAMLVDDVHKSFYQCLHPRKPINAVKGISFSVKKGECFGLLGVNGAGKSTTFKMISGEECTTRGNIFANGHRLKWPRGKYLQSLGYCPQFFGLDEFLTGKQNIALLLTLRGLSQKDVEAETLAWINVVGLEKHQNKLVTGYSGGCMRRLATAAALSLGAAVTLLDEPTAGVDVSARRRVWLALRRGLRHDRSVIITSHSMDEMEALCDRIAIMSAGELGALGSAGALKAAFASGHAVVIKLASTSGGATTDTTDGAPRNLHQLKETFLRKFNSTLKDEHKTMLHYHINESMRYSDLFAQLEELKREFPDLIEDYSVTETTLEEVFLSFAQPHAPQQSHAHTAQQV